MRTARSHSRLRQRRAAAATEYILIMALIVLPIGLMLPTFMKMIKVYSGRTATMVVLPFP
jgi:hypothetical protein